MDKISDPEVLKTEAQKNPEAICISSKNGTGLDILRNAVVNCYENKLASCQININYEHAKLIPQIRKHVVIVKTDYEDTFIRLDLRLPPGGKEKIREILKHTNQTLVCV
jgi:50S ribosomal subunit-associated GTPase HflX